MSSIARETSSREGPLFRSRCQHTLLRVAVTVLVALATAPVLAAQAPAAQAHILDTLRLPVRYEQVHGQRLAYYEAGAPSAPVVILVPSLTWDAHAWAQNVEAFTRDYRVIVIDPLGTGRSDKPRIDFKMHTWTDGFAEFMRLKGIDKAAFVGAVMGGALAVQMALDHPERVSAIVVAASNSGPGPHAGPVRSMLGGPGPAGVRANLLATFFDSTMVTDSLVSERFAQRQRAGDEHTIRTHLADHRPRYTEAELARIAVPALIVWCREDQVTPLSWGEDFAKPLPAGRLVVIERCGHYPNLEQPAAFNVAVTGFLATAIPRPPAPPRGAR